MTELVSDLQPADALRRLGSTNAPRGRTVSQDLALAQKVIDAARAETVAEQLLRKVCENPHAPRHEIGAAARRLQLARIAREHAIEELDS